METILSKLESTDEVNIDEVINDFFHYYRTNERHNYHELTIYVLNKMRNRGAGEDISILLENLYTVLQETQKRCMCTYDEPMHYCRHSMPKSFECENEKKDTNDNYCYDYKWLYNKLKKLYDHITLENIRTSDIVRDSDEMRKMLKSLSEKEQVLTQKVSDDIDRINENKSFLQKTEERISGIEKNYITILGIFASIVLSFTGGLAFSSSILENIDASSPYRLAAVGIGIAFVLVNIIYILVWFILELNKKEGQNNSYPTLMWVLNIVLIVSLVITICMWNSNKAENELLTNESDLYKIEQME